MGNTKEVMRGLQALGHLSLLLLIPILIGVFGGILVDGKWDISPVGTVIGSLIGIAAAFRNLYVWSIRQIADSRKSERAKRALRESGLWGGRTQEEDTSDGTE